MVRLLPLLAIVFAAFPAYALGQLGQVTTSKTVAGAIAWATEARNRAANVDDELRIPTRVAAFGRPPAEGAKAEPIEAYTFVDLNLHPEFTDEDFDEAPFLGK